MRLIIAEKPSLGRAIAAVLPGPQRRENGLVRCADGTVVSWCIGHLLEPAEPGSYDAQWQKWRLDMLPMFPEQWQRQPRPKVQGQLKLLKKLIGEAQLVVHAGDPDREGQLLVDEVLQWSNCRVPVRRLLINDLNPEAVRRALTQEKDNREFQPLSASAEARQQADWLFGLNLTRACTLLKRGQNDRSVYSIGRVQTPLLGLVVERDNRIDAFVPVPFFRIQAQVQPGQTDDPEAATFTATWQASEEYAEHLDEENRLLSEAVAQSIARAVKGSPGQVGAARFKERREPPPLPLSLSALQIEAARLFELSAQAVLDTAQSLYENHRLITYPRSDCRYLPAGHWPEATGVIAAVAGNLPELGPGDAGQAGNGLDPKRRSRAWDDSKVEAHHAIIPTRRQADMRRLDVRQKQIYSLICRYYLMQFMADALHRDGRLECRFGEHLFLARETGLLEPGWQALELRKAEAVPSERKAAAPLPRLKKGAPVLARDCEVLSRKTQPPQPFTDATLLGAMTGIARFVKDPELRRTLRETDGLGTEATRAGIIETLFKREYLAKEGRYIRSTPRGRELIADLPKVISAPDRTAHWESTLEQVRFGTHQPGAFIAELQAEIRDLIADMSGQGREVQKHQPGTSDDPQCPACRSPMRRREGPYGEFWSCHRYPDCRATRRIQDELADQDGTRQAPVPCPHCYAPLKRRQGKHGWFWGCTQYPACRQTVPDQDGKPALSPRG